VQTHSTLPILLKNQKILLIGGGKVALQKAQVLAENQMEFRVISETIMVEMIAYTHDFHYKPFQLSDLRGYHIVIDATGNPEVAEMLVAYKRQHPILLNVVDVPKLCDFYFMALTPNQPLQIAVTSNGASPTAAKFFRDECAKLIPTDIDAYLQQKQAERDQGIIDVKKTTQELQQLGTESFSFAGSGLKPPSPNNQVYLVGCGIGDPELLTIKAYKIIQSVDVVLYDHLISQEIMALVPKQTKQVFVGKQKGFHSMAQEAINDLILTYASQGLSVARLKSGDPFVFGRGAEELQSLVEQGVQTEVIPGISSSISAPLMADIPITARGYASGFTVVSAHLRGNSVNLDWIDLMQKPNHTIVVLMGLSRVPQIVDEAKRLGVSGEKPCAIIANASRKNQQVMITTLDQLEEEAKMAERPAILVFGEVVNFTKNLESTTCSHVDSFPSSSMGMPIGV
ncbi:MAG TPA: uroporphyrinogen-III C-methyltransferase, partial [Campylobacterales bacterium]|nr:uroporphyrinogen-III C-methyltransferase [Campylobacterales bacterium]